MPTFSNIFSPLRIDQGDILRRRHDHRAGYRHLLRPASALHRRSWRHIDDQIIEIFHVRLLEQLLQRLRHHRCARQTIGESTSTMKPIEHRLQPMRLHRLHRLAVRGIRLLPGKPQHLRNRRPVDIGVEQT